MDALCRPAVAEDAVHYQLFLAQTSPAALQSPEEHLQQLLEKILAEVAPLLVYYIWQNQPFNLKICPQKGGVPAHLGGSTKFGDNVEDEWFIVYVLQQITRCFPQLAARVQDLDGEFLLIEAAEYLPKWLNPDTSNNRVFLYRGELHILPIPSTAEGIGFPKNVVPNEVQALVFLTSHQEACLANGRIRSAVRKRLDGYPGKIHTNLHRTSCFVPAGIATVLSRRPDLLAPAVSAFYLRDPLDLQACRRFHTFPPETRVLTSVVFTRCLYAQLQQQRFTPDGRSGYTLPQPSDPKYRAHELGMKLAHGFEILCAKCRQPSSEPDAPISCNPFWKGFVESLKKNDYFRGQLEGSARYRELMNSAQSFFRQSITTSHRSPGEEVLEVLQSSPINMDVLKEQEAHLPPDDSDSWLDVKPQELERLLEEASGSVKPQAEVKYEGGSYDLVELTQGMKSFINTVSSHEGAELPWSYSSEPFNFDPETMTNALEKLLGNKDAELDSDDLEDDQETDESDEDDPVKSEGGSDGAEALSSLKRYMEVMDKELEDTSIGQSFSKAVMQDSNKPGHAQECPPATRADVPEEEEEIQPLDIDLNLVTNLLESLSSQSGMAGPASNLLQSLGIQLPPNAD